MKQEGKELDAAGPLYVALTEYKKTGPATPSPLSVDTPGDKRSGPVEDRVRRILERREAESGEESMDETLSEAGEDMEVGKHTGAEAIGGRVHHARTVERSEWRKLGRHPHATSDLISPQESRVTTDERESEHGNDLPECGKKGEEHLRGKQGCFPRHSG